jgi:hypothetical protein
MTDCPGARPILPSFPPLPLLLPLSPFPPLLPPPPSITPLCLTFPAPLSRRAGPTRLLPPRDAPAPEPRAALLHSGPLGLRFAPCTTQRVSLPPSILSPPRSLRRASPTAPGLPIHLSASPPSPAIPLRAHPKSAPLTDFACPPKQKLLTAISRERFLSLHPLRCSTAHAPAAGSRRPMHHVPRLAPSSATHRVAFLRSTRRHFPLHVHLHQVALRSPSHREPSDPALPRRLPVPAPAHAPAPSGFRTAPLLLAVPSPLTPLSHFLPHPTNSLPFAPDLAAAPSTSLQLLFRLLPTRSPLPTLPHDPR